MIDTALLAFAIGVKGVSPSRAYVFVRDAGPPVPFELKLRQRQTKEAPWVDVEGISYFPPKPRTTKTGRRVTLVVPDNLERFVQVCATTPPSYESPLKRRSLSDLKPKPEAESDSGFTAQFHLRVSACVNLLPRRSAPDSTS